MTHNSRKAQYVQRDNGQMNGSVGGPGVDAPTAQKWATIVSGEDQSGTEPGDGRIGNAGAGEMLTLTIREFGEAPMPQAAKGIDAPPLSVQTRRGERLYVTDPALAEWVAANPDEALAEGKAFPSVTTAIKGLDKPALVPWAAGQAAAHATDRLFELQAHLVSGDADGAADKLGRWLTEGDRGRPVVHDEIAAAYRSSRDTAAGRGTDVHAILEEIVRGEDPEVPEDLAGYVRGFHAFREAFPEIEFAATEVTVVNEEDSYAGTADAIVKVGDAYYVLDYKTNKNAAVYDSVGLQLAAIAHAPHIVHPDGSRTKMPPIAGGIAVGLAPNGRFNVVPFNTADRDGHFRAFRAAVQVWFGQRKTKKTRVTSARSAADIHRLAH